MNEQNLEKRSLIGANLAQARRTIGLTQQQVALQIFGSKDKAKKMSDIERGLQMPDAELLQTLCLLYGVSSDWIYGFSDAVELDPQIGNAGVLFTKLYTQIEEAINKISLELCLIGAKQLPNIPHSKCLELLNIIKSIEGICSGKTHINTACLNDLFKISKELNAVIERQEHILLEQLEGFFSEAVEYHDTANLITNTQKDSRRIFTNALSLNKKKGSNAE